MGASPSYFSTGAAFSAGFPPSGIFFPLSYGLSLSYSAIESMLF